MKFRIERDALAEAVAWSARSLPSRPSTFVNEVDSGFSAPLIHTLRAVGYTIRPPE